MKCNLLFTRVLFLIQISTYHQVKHRDVCFIFYHWCHKCSIGHWTDIYHNQCKRNRLVSWFRLKKKWIIKKTIDVAFNLLKPIGPLLYSCRECLRALVLSSGVLSFLFLRNVLGCDTASIAQWLHGLKLKELTVTIIGYDFRVRFRFTVIIPVALLILNDSSGSLAAIWNNETQRYVCL